MENGGNVRAHDYFKKHGAVFGNVIDYKHQAVQKYKQELERKVLSIKFTKLISIRLRQFCKRIHLNQLLFPLLLVIKLNNLQKK